MMLRRRAAITSLALALPAAALLTWVSDRWRTADAAATLERVVRSQVNEQNRERCESDPTWFLTGPLDGRPPRGVPDPNPDALPPRPKVIPQPFELFAYDEEFVGSSPASPRFPDEFKRSLRRETRPLSGQFDTDNGTGVQFVVPTGWVGTLRTQTSRRATARMVISSPTGPLLRPQLAPAPRASAYGATRQRPKAASRAGQSGSVRGQPPG